MKKEKIKILLIILVAMFLIGSFGATAYFYKQYAEAKKNPNKASNDEATALISKISKNMSLPADETPTVATISDVDKLKDQAFFKNTQNGDKVLIYVNAKKAIVYRPSTQKIVEFGLVINDSGAPAPANTETNTPTASPVSVVIYSGTEKENLLDETEKKVGDIKDLKVVEKTTVAKSDYAQTIVVDITGSNEAKASEIAAELNGVVSNLPDGENKPETDILIITGSKE